MPICPICSEDINADNAAFNHHVNTHLDDSPTEVPLSNGHAGAGPRAQIKDEEGPAECPMCGFPFDGVPIGQRQSHIETCLDGPNESAQPSIGCHSGGPVRGFVARQSVLLDSDSDLGGKDFDYTPENIQSASQAVDSDWVEVGWSGPAKPGGWHDWVHRKTERGDKWLDPNTLASDGAHVPSNFCPSMIPVLHRLLTLSSHRNATRHAVLCSPTTLIRWGWSFDTGWGCGYRNVEMALSALLQFPFRPEYREIFDPEKNGSEPGVRRVQGWIEEAWAEGFDPDGRAHFKGKLLGTRKWIGTGDMYSMFSYKSVPCELYDFPKPKGGRGAPKTAHINLQQWVRSYFAEDASNNKSGFVDHSAFDVLMRTQHGGQGRGEAVRYSTKLPLILQHSGHSRTIVGYEETGQGHINLLLFDPGRSISNELRNAGIEKWREEAERRQSQSSSSLAMPVRPPHPINRNSHDSSAPSDMANSEPSTSSQSGMNMTNKASRQSLRRKRYNDTHEPLPFSPPYTNGDSQLVNASPTEIMEDDEDFLPPNGHPPVGGFRPDIIHQSSYERKRQSSSMSQHSGDVQLNPYDDEIMEQEEEGPRETAPPEVARPDEEIDESGWVRKKLKKTFGLKSRHSASDKPSWEEGPTGVSKSLDRFRVNLARLSVHTEYQVLAFTGGAPLSSAERRERRVVTSTRVGG